MAKRSVIVVDYYMRLFILATLILSSLSIVPAVFAQPSISFEDETVDFGDVTQGDLLEHNFVFRNNGTDILVIQKVTAS